MNGSLLRNPTSQKNPIMKRLNVRMIVGLLVITGFLTAGLALLHHFQAGRIRAALLWQADRAQADKHPAEAIKYLGQYLEFLPTDTAQRARLARLLWEQCQAGSSRPLSTALDHMERVLRENPEDDDTRRLLVRATMAIRRFDASRDNLEQLASRSPHDAEIDYLYAQWHEVQGRQADAALWYRKSIADDPHRLDSYERLADLEYLAPSKEAPESRGKKALKVLDEMVLNNPKAARAYVARARLHLTSAGKPTPESHADIARALALAPDDVDVLTVAASGYRASGELGQARACLRRGVPGHASDSRLYEALAQLDLEENKPDAAARTLREGIGNVQGEPRARLQLELANLLIDQGRVEDATATYEALRELHINPGHLDLLRARIEMRQKNWQAAITLFQRATPLLDGQLAALDRIDQSLAECYQRTGQPAHVVEACRRLVLRHPDSREARAALAGTLAAAGCDDEANAILMRLEKEEPLPPHLFRTAALVALRCRDRSRALQLAQRAVPAESTNPHDLLWRANVLASCGSPNDDVDHCLQRALALAPNQVDGWLTLVRFYGATNQPARAHSAIEQMSASVPPARCDLARALAFESIGDIQSADKQYRKMVASAGRDTDTLEAAAAFYERANQPVEAERLLRQAIDKSSAPAGKVAWARRQLALLIAPKPGIKNQNDALAMLNQSSAGVRDLDRGDSDYIRVRARILANFPDRNSWEGAIALLEPLLQRGGLSDDDRLLLAQLYERHMQWASARELLRNFAVTPASAANVAWAADAYLRHGDIDLAGDLIERLSEADKKLGRTSLKTISLRAEWLETRHEEREAIAIVQDAAKDPSGPPQALLVAARLLARHDKLAEAIQCLDQAWAKCPAPDVGAACVAVMLEGKPRPLDWQHIREQLQQARDANPSLLELQLNLANIMELTDDFAAAEQLYRAVLKANHESVVALNNLAWLLSRRRDGCDEAATLIDRAIELYGARPELLDTRGMIRFQAGKPDLALADLSSVTTEAPSAGRLLHLARAQAAFGQRQEARQSVARAKSAGLDLKRLHPIEREACRTFIDELSKG